MPTRGRLVCHVHCLVHDGVVRSSPCRPHHENFGRNLYHMFVPAYSASQSFVFVLSCVIRVTSKSNVDSIPSTNGVFILRCEYQSFMIIEIVMSILFTGVFLFKWIRTFQHPQDPISAFSTVFVSPIPSCLCFPTLPPLFLIGLGFLYRVSILLM
jgi:hypothetical protein